MNLYLDAFVFSLPKPTEEPARITTYFQQLLSWKRVGDLDWVRVFIGPGTVEILMDSKTYPLWDLLVRLSSKLDNVFQPRDVVRVVDSLLTKAIPIGDSIGVSNVLVDDFSCEPSYHLAGRPTQFKEHFEVLTACVFMAITLLEWDAGSQVVATRDLKPEDLDLIIHSEIIAIDQLDGYSNGNLPLQVHLIMKACSHGDVLDLNADPVEIVQTLTSENAIRHAVRIYLRQAELAGQVAPLPGQISTWQMGSEFLKSAERLGFLAEATKVKKLLRAIAASLTLTTLESTHQLRVDRGPSSQQLLRSLDGAGAWRRDIDREYHLHYWEVSDTIEFASVSTHSDYSIPG